MSRTCLVLLVLWCAPWECVRAENRDSVIDAAAEQIDSILAASWRQQGITPATISDDSEFCRRVWLDLGGIAPPVSELRRFVRSDAPDKRAQLIDRLIRSPQHASHLASRWIDVLLPTDTQFESRQNTAALHQWLQRQFVLNTPYDYLVGGFLTAGGAADSGPAIFYTAHELEPKKLASATSQIFMGIQLQCAECHDHPTDRWRQEDFWQYAAFFSQLERTDGAMGRDTIIEDRPGGEVTLPDTEHVMKPRYPGIDQVPEQDPTGNRRRQLTIWMASRDNPYFARAAVNRVWDHMFGRGLVDPVDSMDADNPPSHPELLEYLADFFVQRRFNLRDLYAAIARSDAYGRTSRVGPAERPPLDSFAAMNIKTLTAAQYYDSLQQNVLRRSMVIPSDMQSADRAMREQFLTRMQTSESTPREYPHGVVQALGMMNGPEAQLATNEDSGALLHAIEAPFFDDTQRIETLFLATLSRWPTPGEMQQFEHHVAQASSSRQRRAALSDVLWILLNTAECAVCP